ncbi:MAG: hypothetical protein ACLF0P_03860 [Thermoanaerobaculia bacterium]
MTMKSLTGSAVAFLLILAAAPVADATGSRAVLGDRGELYVARTGTYAELFPDGKALPGENPVLALDVLQDGEERRRSLVVGSEGPEVERAATLVFEPDSKTLYAVWESRRSPSASALYLAGFHGGEWGEPLEISGDTAPLKGVPQVLVQRDEVDVPDALDDGVKQGDRTLLHVLWWEQAAGSGGGVQYAPVLFERGEYLGWNPVIRLADLDPAPQSKSSAELPAPLLRSPQLDPGTDLRAAITGLVNPETGRLLAIEARLLPAEIGMMADELRAQIIAIGFSKGPDRIAAIRDELRAQIIAIGRNLNPGTVQHVAARSVKAAESLVEERPEIPLEVFADELRAQIIAIGSRWLVDLERRNVPEVTRVLELQAQGGGKEIPPAVPHLLRLDLVHSRPAPPTGPGTTRVFLSETGERVVAAWIEEGEVYYTESIEATGPGEPAWSQPKRLVFDESVEGLDPVSILRDRVRQQD